MKHCRNARARFAAALGAAIVALPLAAGDACSASTLFNPKPQATATLPCVRAVAFGSGLNENLGDQKQCPTCKRSFPAADRFCPVDGVPLVDAEAATNAARICPVCKRKYDGTARFCSVDGAPLPGANEHEGHGVAKSSKPGANPATKPAADSSVEHPGIGRIRSITSAKGTAGGGDSNAADSTTNSAPACSLAGAIYVVTLRSSLEVTGPEREALSDKLDALAKRCRKERRVVVAIQVGADEETRAADAAAIERELTGRLRATPARDVDLVTSKALSASLGWKRLLIAGKLAPAGDDPTRLTVELSLRDTDRGAEVAREHIEFERSGTDSAAIEADARNAADQIALAAARYFEQLRLAHFDAAAQLARDGQSARATEEFLRFLFTTAEFDSPQADEANQFVIGELGFSVLDWIWGDPDLAVADTPPARRLPLGFRPTSESRRGELPRSIVSLRDGAEMVLVPGGTELMGNPTGSPDERPAHAVELGPFYIDKLETGVAAYERFLTASGHRVPLPESAADPIQWIGRQSKPDAAQLPVVQVSWHDAKAFAQWTGKSLPSEAEWERAARGHFGADYPRAVDRAFGQRVNAGRGQKSEIRDQKAEFAARKDSSSLMSVFSFPAALNPHGCQNMLGNAAEWCRDWYDADYYAQFSSQEPFGPDTGELRVIRGGSWRTPLDQLGVTRRTALDPTTRAADVGFRCVLVIPNAH